MRTNIIRFNGYLDAHFTAEIEGARTSKGGSHRLAPQHRRSGQVLCTLLCGVNEQEHRTNKWLVHRFKDRTPFLAPLNGSLSPTTDSRQLFRADLELFPFSARGKRMC